MKVTCVSERALVVIGFLLVLAILVNPTVRADWVYTGSVYDGTITVSGYEYAYASVFHFVGQKVVIAFNCVGGGDAKVDFALCDAGDLYLLESQYGSWELQGSFIGYLQSIHFRGPIQIEGVSSWEGEFEVSHTGNWFYLFSNMFAVTTKTVQLALEVYQWRDLVILAVVVCVLALGVLGAIAGVVIHHRRKHV
jgi:hypothetical protein